MITGSMEPPYSKDPWTDIYLRNRDLMRELEVQQNNCAKFQEILNAKESNELSSKQLAEENKELKAQIAAIGNLQAENAANIRDAFAMEAMKTYLPHAHAAMLAERPSFNSWAEVNTFTAKVAYELADKMIEARNQK